MSSLLWIILADFRSKLMRAISQEYITPISWNRKAAQKNRKIDKHLVIGQLLRKYLRFFSGGIWPFLQASDR